VIDRGTYNEDKGYKALNIVEAEKIIAEKMVTDISKDYPPRKFHYCTPIYQFRRFGVGIYLYFLFIKWMAWGFTVMSILMLPSLISNA
jgi:hypothetical protein